MWKHVIALTSVAFLLLPTGAAAQDITRDWDRAYDFSKIKTFAIKIGTSWGNPLSEQRVTEEFAEALTAKGWTRAPEGSADAMVVLHGAGETKHNVSTFYDGWGGGWGYRGFQSGSSTTMVSEYKVGTLVADVFDTQTKKLVYRGSATDEISDDPNKNIKKAEKAAQKMFKDFPPKEKDKK